MAERNDGGPAFPQEFAMSPKPYQGMSLRDYFAAAALQGILACVRDFHDADDRLGRVRIAYDYADAMLAAREKAND